MNIQIIKKPWGQEIIWSITQQYAAKILEIKKDHQLSLQLHRIKQESIFIESGELLLILEDASGNLQEHPMQPGDTQIILPNKKHRMIAKKDCRVFEVSTPELDDIIRFEDSYGRVSI